MQDQRGARDLGHDVLHVDAVEGVQQTDGVGWRRRASHKVIVRATLLYRCIRDVQRGEELTVTWIFVCPAEFIDFEPCLCLCLLLSGWAIAQRAAGIAATKDGSIAAGTWRRRPFAGGLNVELSLPIFRLALAVFIPWRGADGFRPARGMAPALMLCWIEGGAGFFLFSVLPGGAVELPGRSRPAPGVVDHSPGGSMSSSLSRFSGWRSRSLSLGEGLTDSTGARDGTRADAVLDRGRRRLFHF